MILALLQLKNGRINFGSLSFLSPRTGLRNTATRSELDASGARSPTKILYSFWYCCACWVFGSAVGITGYEIGDAEGTLDAQFITKGLEELGIIAGLPFPALLICAKTDAACAGVGKVKKQ